MTERKLPSVLSVNPSSFSFLEDLPHLVFQFLSSMHLDCDHEHKHKQVGVDQLDWLEDGWCGVCLRCSCMRT